MRIDELQTLAVPPAGRPGGVFAALAIAAVAGVLSLPLSASAQTPKPSAERLQSWKTAVKATPFPKTGCFTAAFPTARWQEVACVDTAAEGPRRPRGLIRGGGGGGGADVVGNGNDYALQVSRESIGSVTGTFPSVKNVTSEVNHRDGMPGSFSLQMNSNYFNTSACNGVSGCQGWQQFVYDNQAGVVFMQYWLIGAGSTCPSAAWGRYGDDCYTNSQGASFPQQPIQNLSQMGLTAVAGGTDAAEIFTDGGLFAQAVNNDSFMGLDGKFTGAEFNIIGNDDGARADFNGGVGMTVNLVAQTTNGKGETPICLGPNSSFQGFTGETNNLNLGSCSASGKKGGMISFTQSDPPGAIYSYTGRPCSGATCKGWTELDNNDAGVRIATTGANLYEMWNTGYIYQYTGTACSKGSCPGWELLNDDVGTDEVVAAGGQLYLLDNSGLIEHYTGQPCSFPNPGQIVCQGWAALDDSPLAVSIAASSGGLYELHSTGTIWQSTGATCSNGTCPPWVELDNNAATTAITTGNDNLFELHSDGTVWKYIGPACNNGSCPGWELVNNNPSARMILASGNNLYELDYTTGAISQWNGTPCNGDTCNWTMLDDNPLAAEIASDGTNLYELHSTGSVLKYNGRPCNGNSCEGWQQLDDNANTGRIEAGAGGLYQIHETVVGPSNSASNSATGISCYECR